MENGPPTKGWLLPIALILLTAVVAVVGGSWALGVGPLRCVGRGLDSDEWFTGDKDSQARTMVECESLEGLTIAEVEVELGPPQRRGERTWTWAAGVTNGSDDQSLTVVFGGDDRVEQAKVAYGP